MATLQKTRKQYIDAIANKRDFKSSTGNLRGHSILNGKEYVVYSYDTCIARYTFGFGWWTDETKYSVTTTHHQHIVAMAIR